MNALSPEDRRMIARVAARVTSLEKDFRRASRTASQAYSSQEGGTHDVYDDEGNLRVLIGEQPDGSITIADYNGPALDTPSAPIVEERPGALVVTWDGTTDAGDAEWPAAFGHVKVLITTDVDEDVDWSQATQIGVMSDPLGGSLTVSLPAGVVFVLALVAVNTSGVWSAVSASTLGTPDPSAEPYEPPPASDGTPPVASPVPVVRGGIGSLVVVVPPIENPDPVTVDVFVSASTPVDTTGTPTVSAPGYGPSLHFVREVGGQPVTAGTTYYVVTVAREDIDGPGPVSAQASGTPAQVTGPDIAVNALTADLLIGNNALLDALAAVTVTADEVKIGEAYWNVTEGLVIPTSVGDIVFPVDGITPARISGYVVASKLEVKDGLAVSGTGSISGSVVLSNSVTPPLAGPSVTGTYPSYPPVAGTSPSAMGAALSNDNTKMVTWLLEGSTWRLFSYSRTGAVAPVVHPSTAPITTTRNVLSCVTIGTTLYTLISYPSPTVSGTSVYAVLRHNLGTGAFLGESQALDSSVGTANNGGSDETGDPAICYLSDDNTIGYAKILADGTVFMASFNLDLTAVASDTITVPAAFGRARPLRSFFYGQIDASIGKRLYLGAEGFGALYAYTRTNGTTYARAAANDFARPAGDYVGGLTWDTSASRFLVMSRGGRLYPMSKLVADTTVYASQAWYDGITGTYPPGHPNAGSASTTHETTPSPASSGVVPARAWPTIEAGSPPQAGDTDATHVDKADRVAIYAGTSPTVTAHRLQSRPPVGSRKWVGDALLIALPAPKTVNEFAGIVTVPGELKSAATTGGAPTWRVGGDGAWRFGPLSGDATGAIAGNLGTGTLRDDVDARTDRRATEWASMSVGGGFGAVSGQTAEYRRDAAGNIHLRGAILRSSASSGAIVATLPVGFRPLGQACSQPCRTSSNGVTALITITTDGKVALTWTGTPTAFGIETIFSSL